MFLSKCLFNDYSADIGELLNCLFVSVDIFDHLSIFFRNVFDPRQMRISVRGSGVYIKRERGCR